MRTLMSEKYDNKQNYK